MNADGDKEIHVGEARVSLLSNTDIAFASKFDCGEELETLRSLESVFSDPAKVVDDLDGAFEDVLGSVALLKQKAHHEAAPIALAHLRSTAAGALGNPHYTPELVYDLISKYFTALTGPDIKDINDPIGSLGLQPVDLPTKNHGPLHAFVATDLSTLMPKKEDMQAVRNALGVVLAPCSSFNEQMARDTILTWQGDFGSLRYKDQPVEGNVLEYFGQKFHIQFEEGIPFPRTEHLSFSEIGIGVLAVYSQYEAYADTPSEGREPIAIVDVRPGKFEYGEASDSTRDVQAQPIESLNTHFIGLKATRTDVKEFLRNLDDVSEKIDYYHPGVPNINWMPIESKLRLFTLLNNPTTAEAAIQTFHMFSDSPWVFQMSEDHPEYINYFSGVLGRLYSRESPPLDSLEVINTVRLFCLLEKFAFEASWWLTPAGERMQEGAIDARITLFAPIVRQMFGEYMQSIMNAKEDEVIDQSRIHALGADAVFRMIERSVGIQTHTYTPEPFTWHAFEDAERIRSTSPDSSMTYQVVRSEVMAHALANQHDVSEAERQAWLANFYHHVIAQLGVYETNTAQVYKDVSGIEANRFRIGLPAIRERILADMPADSRAEVESGKRPLRILSVGCGDMNNMEGPIYDELASPQFRLEVTGVDPYPQGDTAYWRMHENTANRIIEVVTVPLEDFLKKYPKYEGSFDLVVMIGSPLNNMEIERVQLDYFDVVDRSLADWGRVMIETGDPALFEEVNKRTKWREDLFIRDPNNPPGAFANLPEYLQAGEPYGNVGGLLYFPEMLAMLGSDAGLVIESPRDPSTAALNRMIGSPVALLQATKENQNPLDQPFYVANPPGEWNGKDPLNIRVMYTMKKVTGPGRNVLLEILKSRPDQPDTVGSVWEAAASPK